MRLYRILFVLAFLICSTYCYAQPGIDSIRLLPLKPVRNDTVRIALYTYTTTVGIKVHLTHIKNGNDIYIEGCYSISGAAAFTLYKDTITMGELKDGTYKVHIALHESTSKTQCNYIDSTIDSLTFVVDAPASIPLLNAASFTIYPSPANDVLHISCPSGASIQNASIYDVQGTLLRQYPDNKKPIDISGIPAGMYILFIDTDKGRVVKKFMKE